jgi:hypothetical protein
MDRSTVHPGDNLSVERIPGHLDMPGDVASVLATGWQSATRLRQVLRDGLPRPGLPRKVNMWRLRNQRHLWRGLLPLIVARLFHQHRIYGALWVDAVDDTGARTAYGLASLELVTTAGVGYIVDAWQNLAEMEAMKYHAVGTGTTDPAIGDTALGAEATTALNPDSTRGAGSLTEGTAANIFRTVATNTFDASAAVSEVGLFNQQATGGGVLFDHFVFAALPFVSGDSFVSTIDVTFPPGS